MDFITIVLTAVGLAMDAFAVAIADGMQVQGRITLRPMTRVAVFFGFFQGLMTLLGYLLGSTFREQIQWLDHWIAFILLALIGGNLLREGFANRNGDCPPANDALSSFRTLTLQAIATSIDALAVGVSFSLISDLSIGLVVGVIAVVAFLFAFAGVYIGCKLGCVMQSSAEILGGFMLIGIGLKILFEHLIQQI